MGDILTFPTAEEAEIKFEEKGILFSDLGNCFVLKVMRDALRNVDLQDAYDEMERILKECTKKSIGPTFVENHGVPAWFAYENDPVGEAVFSREHFLTIFRILRA